VWNIIIVNPRRKAWAESYCNRSVIFVRLSVRRNLPLFTGRDC
jgi:hypothetical protein